jgi:hypothetical protein
MATPNKLLTARNCSYVLQNPLPNSNTAIKSKLQTRVHFLPNRSARTPKIRAPRDRNRSVRVILVVMALVSLPNVSDRCLAERETEKKLGSALVDVLLLTYSYPSIVHASQPEKNMSHPKPLTIPSSLKGFFVTLSSTAGVCQVGIIALKKDLFPRFECHVSS